MTPDRNQPAHEGAHLATWVQTRVVLRIIVLLLAVAAVLWIVYKLTTVLLNGSKPRQPVSRSGGGAAFGVSQL